VLHHRFRQCTAALCGHAVAGTEVTAAAETAWWWDWWTGRGHSCGEQAVAAATRRRLMALHVRWQSSATAVTSVLSRQWSVSVAASFTVEWQVVVRMSLQAQSGRMPRRARGLGARSTRLLPRQCCPPLASTNPETPGRRPQPPACKICLKLGKFFLVSISRPSVFLRCGESHRTRNKNKQTNDAVWWTFFAPPAPSRTLDPRRPMTERHRASQQR
jgi:hypothetical protein